ncbi:MAG: Ldh family oxidoreductase [Rhodocyclaceae bacterium]|nr:Ldh family oxidoreductase [Rhodocyclaceae bacterium]MCA3075572.1 Ldh family oxidoreductase [Rhodocyclaceae bacterium]MCA3092074.1 Ldh family oxidoreductase [Rhodocyclaceae bacterium]MCA3095969.1 Ldh family oxidoreductase [Rhodocyclaceae bacterium]MCA3099572.1 Ldh family oxidoreductase [Rhodocyclaceae bacterium]
MALPVAYNAVHRFAVVLLASAGMPTDDAACVADLLVWADLRGVHSHGVSRLPQYAGWLASGEMNATPSIRVLVDLPALQVIEGDRCAGALGMRHAVDAVIDRARSAGSSVALLRATTHTGAVGFHTERIARAGMLGVAAAASVPLMAYHGAGRAALGTAPLSIAAPRGAGHAPVVFDMASAVVAMGKLRQARVKGEPIPADWALDANGHPTTDPALAKVPLPVGGAKGSGLALMFEVVASLLTANPILAPALATGGAKYPHVQNAFVMALDIDRIVDPTVYRSEIEALAAAIHALPPSGASAVLLPGERGESRRAEQARAGIALPAGVRHDLATLASKYRVPVPW